jgi:hypothetical protein
MTNQPKQQHQQQPKDADHRTIAPPPNLPRDEARQPRRWVSWARQEERK